MTKKIESMAVRLLLVLAAVCMTVSCGDDPVTPQAGVVLDEATVTNQVLYADQTTGDGQIKFTANGTWVAAVVSVQTREIFHEPVNWLQLSAFTGGAGENSIGMTLTENNTGQARKANVNITCAGTTVTVTVEQKAERKGSQPGVEIKGIVKQVTCNVTEDGVQTGTTTMNFTYDAQGRLSSVVQDMQEIDDEESGSEGTVNSRAAISFAYGNNTASYSIAFSIEGTTVDDMSVNGNAKLDAKGRVVSGDCVENDGDDDDDEDSDDTPITYALTYDANGYLQKSEGRNGDGAFSTALTWQNGNLTSIDWNTGSVSGRRDNFAYGAQENCANIDLNWLVSYDSDGAELASGDPYKMFGIAGMLGCRARNVATRLVGTSWSDVVVKCECDAKGRPVKMVVASADSSDGEREEYTITYTK